MKKLLLIPLIALCSCVAPKYSESIYVSDFTEFVKQGFSIYPVGTDIKQKNYVPVAELSMDFNAGIAQNSQKEKHKPKYNNSNPYILPSGDYMTERIVSVAQGYGANAIINFLITPIRTAKGMIVGYNAKCTAVKIE